MLRDSHCNIRHHRRSASPGTRLSREAREIKQEDHELEPFRIDEEVLDDSDETGLEFQNEGFENASQLKDDDESASPPIELPFVLIQEILGDNTHQCHCPAVREPTFDDELIAHVKHCLRRSW